MKRFFRRKKKLIIRLSILLALIIFIVLLVLYVLPKAGITTINNDNTNNSSEEVEVTIIDDPKPPSSLPEYITTADDEVDLNNIQTNVEDSNSVITTTTGANGKSYTSYVDTEEKYFITVLSEDNTLTIMLSNKAQDLLSSTSKAKIGVEYTVSNLNEKIVGVSDFMYSNYEYPILLLISTSGKLYYVDMEDGFETGKFEAEGPIEKVSNIYKVNVVNVTDGDTTYKSAVLTDLDNIGYEFTLDMIGR